MAIGTSDGETFQSEWDFYHSKLFDPRYAQPAPQDLDSLFNDMTGGQNIDANGNPVVSDIQK